MMLHHDSHRSLLRSSRSIMTAGWLMLMILAGGLLLPAAIAQVITASLSGTVTDKTGALVPGASLTLTNEKSGDTRTIKGSNSGSFTFAGVSSGDYTLTVSAPSFEQFKETGIHLDPGDSRKLTAISLEAGVGSTTVTVEAETEVPLDTGERADLITAEQIKHLSVEGRDVTELFKILPGFAITNQGVSNAAFDPAQVNVNGALGNFAANGNPLNGISLKLDGADITDPGNYGAAIQNVNYDQVSEVKVQVSNFGADIANGPVVVTAVTTSGTDKFHGQLYTYARTSQLDSIDALSKATAQPKDPDREIYPGFNISGPILVPGTSFNKHRNLTFFAGAEDYAQRNIYAYGSAGNAIVHALVPTAAMRNGNYSAAELANYLGDLYTQGSKAGGCSAGQTCIVPAYANIASPPTVDINGAPITGGMVPSGDKDPGAAALFANMPLPNQRATVANPYNWSQTDFVNNDMWQAIGRADLNISSKNHLFARYSVERGASGVPQVPYYNPGELNTPGGGLNTINSQSAAANLTTVFTSTLTNQLFGALAYLDSAYTSANVGVLTNYPYQGAYKNGRHPLPELQNYDDPSGLPRQLTPDYSLGPIFSKKFQPDGGDTITKNWRSHTISAGVYVMRVTNNQRTPFVPTNGFVDNYYMNGAGATFTDVDGSTKTFSGNWVANYYEGIFGGYGQTSSLPQVNLYYWDTDFFANDSWRVKPRLTLNLGVRFQHLGEWTDAYGVGLAVFRPDMLSSATPASPYPGFLWHAVDNSIPTSGVSAKPLYASPRVGFAWDIRGNGTTVLRGGWGEYREHDSWNDASNAAAITQNSQSVSYGTATLKAIGSPAVNPPAATLTKSSKYPSNVDVTNVGSYGGAGALSALNATDNEEPLTDTYSLTLNQALPWKLNLLIGYVGNNSRFLLNNGSNQTVALDNINAIPVGGLYRPNPYNGQVLVPAGSDATDPKGFHSIVSSASPAQINEYRPLNTALVQYGALDVPQHNLFANYNALQTGITKQTGRVMFSVNYTFSKALGIRGAFNNGEPGNPFNVWDNYGPESFDRRHIFNASYTLLGGNLVHRRFVGGFTNGWELSGIVNYQSGPSIVVTTSNPGFAVGGTIGNPNASNHIPISNTVFLGTPDVSLQPVLTCDPHTNLGPRQYINGNCFGTPALLNNGPYQYPDLRGPGYFNSDMSLQKTFHLHFDQNVTLRLSAFNFLNHPLPSFASNFPNEYQLNLSNMQGTTFTQGSGANASGLGFGSAPYEAGRRVLSMMLKYSF